MDRRRWLWRPQGAQPEVTTMELFFDLVYVFAVTQLASTLLHSLTLRGALQTAVLFGAVWWVWNYTAWTTSWIDPARLPVRLFLVSSMLLCLVMSAAIPEAFTERGAQFATTVVALQVARPLWMIFAMRGHPLARNYLHVLIWSGTAATLWIAGAAAHGDQRLGWWLAALAVDVGGPAARYAVPALGRRPMASWPMSPEHMGERCRLILLIALGETVLDAGRTFSDQPLSLQTVGILIVAFTWIAALWWLYFARHADEAVARLSTQPDAVPEGADGYNYAHALLVGSLVVVAVGIDLMMTEPFRPTTTTTALVISGGAAMYAVGISAFTAATGGLDRTEAVLTVVVGVALAALIVIGPIMALPTWIQAGATTLVLLSAVATAAVHAGPSLRA